MSRHLPVESIQEKVVATDLSAFEDDFTTVGHPARRMDSAQRAAGRQRAEILQRLDPQRTRHRHAGVAAANHGPFQSAGGKQAIQHCTQCRAEVFALR